MPVPDPRLGALGANARRDTDAHAALMRRALRDGFLAGHACRLCQRFDIPDGVTAADRQKRADRLWKLHWARMRAASHKATLPRAA